MHEYIVEYEEIFCYKDHLEQWERHNGRYIFKTKNAKKAVKEFYDQHNSFCIQNDIINRGVRINKIS